MLAHFIPHKGKGALVVGLPLIIAIILFLICDALRLNEQYIGPVSFLISSFFIWFFDGGPTVLREGFNNYEKSRHTFFWIEIKYWALVLGIVGCIWLGSMLSNKI
jgi:hypothetical protein